MTMGLCPWLRGRCTRSVRVASTNRLCTVASSPNNKFCDEHRHASRCSLPATARNARFACGLEYIHSNRDYAFSFAYNRSRVSTAYLQYFPLLTCIHFNLENEFRFFLSPDLQVNVVIISHIYLSLETTNFDPLDFNFRNTSEALKKNWVIQWNYSEGEFKCRILFFTKGLPSVPRCGKEGVRETLEGT